MTSGKHAGCRGPLVVAAKAVKSFKASQNVFVRAFVCVYGDHPVVDNDNHDEHS